MIGKAAEATFTPDEKGIQCISEREEFTVYVAVMLSGAFEVSAMLVLSSTAYLLPLCLGLYLLAMVVFTVASTCNDFEPQLKICFAFGPSPHLYSMMCSCARSSET